MPAARVGVNMGRDIEPESIAVRVARPAREREHACVAIAAVSGVWVVDDRSIARVLDSFPEYESAREQSGGCSQIEWNARRRISHSTAVQVSV